MKYIIEWTLGKTEKDGINWQRLIHDAHDAVSLDYNGTTTWEDIDNFISIRYDGKLINMSPTFGFNTDEAKIEFMLRYLL